MKSTRKANKEYIENQYGIKFNANDWCAIVNFMDDEIREKLHDELAPCSEQEFFDAYAKAHQEKYGETWELAKPNPVW